MPISLRHDSKCLDPVAHRPDRDTREAGALQQALHFGAGPLPRYAGDPLGPAIGPLGEGDVVRIAVEGDQDEPAAWAEHAPKLRHGTGRVGIVVKRYKVDHGVEAAACNRQAFGVRLEESYARARVALRPRYHRSR